MDTLVQGQLIGGDGNQPLITWCQRNTFSESLIIDWSITNMIDVEPWLGIIVQAFLSIATELTAVSSQSKRKKIAIYYTYKGLPFN